MHRRIIYILVLLIFALQVNAQKSHKQKGKNSISEKIDIEKYKNQCKSLVNFLQGSLNFLGDSSQVMAEKEIIINESYLKIFRDSEVQVEDDLDPHRQVPLRKDVQAYLKDIVFFYKHVKFEYEIKNIEVITNAKNEITFKVTANRNLKGIMVNNDTIDNNLTRYIEINFDPFEKDLKIASVYTTLPNQKEEMRYWWKTLPDSWRMFFGKKALVLDTLPMSRIASFEDSSVVVIIGTDTIISDSLLTVNDSLNIPDSSVVFQTKYVYDTIKTSSTASLDFYLKSIFRLKNLDISNNKTIKTLEPVSGLTDLEVLNCSNTMIDNLLPVRNLSKLKELNASGNKITSLKPLKFCFALEDLNLANTLVDTIDVLSGLKALDKLILDNTKVTDLTPLSELENLRFLSIANTDITDLTPLSNLSSLKRLILKGSNVIDLTPLSDLKSLEYINVDSTNVSDLSPLSQIPTLRTIQANNSAIHDFDGLGSNENLKLIYCDNTKIDRKIALEFMNRNPQIFVVFDSQRLKSWWVELPEIWKNILTKQIKIDSVISKEQFLKVVNTKELSVSGNKEIDNLEPLKMLFRLEKLDISNTNISDLSPLSELNNLCYLNMDNTPVSTVEDLKNMTSLKQVKMDDTKVSDILPLKNNKSLQKIYCDNTGVKKDNVLTFKKYVPDCLVIYQTEILRFWWNNMDETWRNELYKLLGIEEYPSREQLQEIVDTKEIKIKNNASISTLEPLAVFNFLEELTVNFTAITDISVLSVLDSLVVLNLSNNPVVDITPLSNLKNLEKLFLENTGVEDLSPLENMKNLKTLNIAGTKVRKLKPIAGLINLEKLIINNTDISKIKGLENLGKLTLLNCYNTKLKKKDVDSFKASHPDTEIIFY